MKRFTAGVVTGFLVALALFSTAQAALKEEYEALDRFADAFERVRHDYLHDVDASTLIDSAISGMARSLDGQYYSEAEITAIEARQKQGPVGVGVEIESKGGLTRVVSVVDNSPAANAGIRAGDYLVEIDGQSTESLPLDDIVPRLRGDLDSTVDLAIRRAGEVEVAKLKIKRSVIKIQSVKYEVKGNVGYIRVSSFNPDVAPLIENAIHALKKQLGPTIKGYVLDLRNNPGGLLEQGLRVTDLFLGEGEIVSLRGRNPSDNETYKAKSGEELDGKRLIVLINQESAGTSEILAAALQDHSRATIIGTKSHARGAIQTVIRLTKGGALKLTTAQFYRPSGAAIEGVGVVPDQVIPDGSGDPPLSRALAELTEG